MNKKTQSEVIAVLLILGISVSAVYATYRWAVPRVEEQRDSSRVRTVQKIFQEFNRNFEEVLHEGTGSQRVMEFRFEKGHIVISDDQDRITYTINTTLDRVPQEELGLESESIEGGLRVILDIGRDADLRIKGGIPELVLSPRSYTIVIQNTGGNEITITRGLELTGTVRERIIQGAVFFDEDTEGTPEPEYDENSEMPLIGAKVTIMDTNREIVAITKTNSRGEFAAELEYKLVGEGTRYYIQVTAGGFIMKEYDGIRWTSVDYYNGYWNDSANESAPGDDGYVVPTEDNFGSLPITHAGKNNPNTILLPMYQRTPAEILEAAPIAIVVGATNTGGTDLNTEMPNDSYRDPKYYNSLIYDVKDAFDLAPDTSCNHFLVFTGTNIANPSVEDGRILLNNDDIGNSVMYPGTNDQIYIYPLKLLLRDEGFYDSTSWASPELQERYDALKQVGGNKEKVDIFDFSLVIVASGATNDDLVLYHDDNVTKVGTGKNNTLQVLQDYRGTISEFLQTGPFNFKGITFSRGLIGFPQISKYDDDGVDVTPDWKYSQFRGILREDMSTGEWNTSSYAIFNYFDAACDASNDNIPPDWDGDVAPVNDRPRVYDNFVDMNDNGLVKNEDYLVYEDYLDLDTASPWTHAGTTYYNKWYDVVNYPDKLMDYEDNEYDVNASLLNNYSYSWIPDWMGYDLRIGNGSDLSQGHYWESQQSIYYGIITCSDDDGYPIYWTKRKMVYPPLAYDFKGAYGIYNMPSVYFRSGELITSKLNEHQVKIAVDEGTENEGTNAEIAGAFTVHPITSGISSPLVLSTHGYLSILGTGWDPREIAMYRKGFSKAEETEISGGYKNVYTLDRDYKDKDFTDPENLGPSYKLIDSGPSMLIKERKDIDGNLIASILITTYDLDRYGNNAFDYDSSGNIEADEINIGDTHSEVYWDTDDSGDYTWGEDGFDPASPPADPTGEENGILEPSEDDNGDGILDYGEEKWRSYAHRLERNIILWALGHEGVIP